MGVASLLHYTAIRHLDRAETAGAEGNTEYLRRNQPGFSGVEDATLPEIKAHLLARGVDCRPTPSVTSNV